MTRPRACDDDPVCIGFGTVYQVTHEAEEEEGDDIDVVPLRGLYFRAGILVGLLLGLVVSEVWTTLKELLL